LQKVSEPLRDAPDIFFRRRISEVEHSATALDENCSDRRNLAVNSWNVLQQTSEALS
jgi:hypothetical protein